MSEPFVAEVRMWALNFAPRGWAFCNGALLPISQNTALFSLIGTTYGGDGRTTTALPNLQGRVPMHPGRGPGLSPRILGQRGGAEAIVLQEVQMPSHGHTARASDDPGTSDDPTGRVLSDAVNPNNQKVVPLYHTLDAPKAMNAGAVTSTGGGQAHDNMQPSLAINFCIALVGVYPSRA